MIPILVPTVLSGARGPSLDLRFAQWQSLGGLVTFTRSSSATYRDSSGTRQTAGSNVARFDHTAAGVPLGLLIEEGRTNILLNSATLSTQSVSVTAQAYTLSFEGTGTVTLSGASTAGPLVGTGATNRVSLTFTPSAGTLTLTVSGTVEAANLEAGSFGTSWIPTTGASASRAADAATLTGSNFSTWFNGAAGTIVAQVRPSTFSGGIGIINLGDGTSANRLTVYTNGSGVSTLSVDAASVRVADVTNATLTLNAANKMTAAWAINDFAVSANGAAVTSDTSGAVPTGVDRASIGLVGASTYLNGHIQRLTFYPGRLANSRLQALTA